MNVIAGAVLVQHSAWSNAERALEALRAATALDARVIAAMGEAELAALIRAGGTPTVKARRLHALMRTIEHAGGLDGLLALPFDELRAQLLATHGVGPETADVIALYAAGRRVFVIDAYTKRVFRRLALGPREADAYEAWRSYFERAMTQSDIATFQRYHAYIDLHARARCRVRPRCGGCPLAEICAYAAE